MDEMKGRAKNSPQRVRISKDPDERKQEIIETALELFTEYGYRNTSIADIARKMNVSQGLCYRYFDSKDELYEATSALYIDRAMSQLVLNSTDDKSAIEKLHLFGEKLYEYILKHKNIEASYSEKSKVRLEGLNQAAEKMIQILIPIIEQGVSENVFYCTDINDTTRFLVYGMIYAFHHNIPKQNIEEYIQYFNAFLWKQLKNTFQIVSPI